MPRLRLNRPEPLDVDLQGPTLADAISQVVWSYFRHLGTDERGFRAHLEDQAGVHVDESAWGASLFMSWTRPEA